jgi:acetolactate decarboxylase
LCFIQGVVQKLRKLINMKNHKTPTGHNVHAHLSDTIYAALKRHCQHTGETIDHVIQRALAEVLDIEHHTMYQVSTSGALVQGVYQGCVTVGDLKNHGDFGLGTYDSLDGEGLMLDGRIWQALSSGQVVEPPDSATAPFWVCTNFEADKTVTLDSVTSWDNLLTQLDDLRTSDNLFVAFRVDGVFDTIDYRIACKADYGVDLVTATRDQPEFTFKDCQGTLMGFWAPNYARTFNIPGYHLHLLSADHQHGGHVLGIKGSKLKVQVMNVQNVVMALPETPAFLSADLSGDPAEALGQADNPR